MYVSQSGLMDARIGWCPGCTAAPKYLPRIYADSAFRRFFADLDKEDESQKTGKDEEKRYVQI
jgi:hypothetical protein